MYNETSPKLPNIYDKCSPSNYLQVQCRSNSLYDHQPFYPGMVRGVLFETGLTEPVIVNVPIQHGPDSGPYPHKLATEIWIPPAPEGPFVTQTAKEQTVFKYCGREYLVVSSRQDRTLAADVRRNSSINTTLQNSFSDGGMKGLIWIGNVLVLPLRKNQDNKRVAYNATRDDISVIISVVREFIREYIDYGHVESLCFDY